MKWIMWPTRIVKLEKAIDEAVRRRRRRSGP